MTGSNMEGKLIWITGLAGSGKTTIGREVFSRLRAKEANSVFIDGDHFREIMGQASAHTREARFLVAQQIARLCKFLTEQNINVVCATISLFNDIHKFNRDRNRKYAEIYIHCEMDELIRRDQKNLYSRALRKEIRDVVGVDIKFDKPMSPDLEIDNTSQNNLEAKVDSIMNLITKKNETR